MASTNPLAAGWAAEGAPEGSVVLAEYQTQGRGRMGRTWSAAPGLNLTFSVVLYPRLEPDALGLLTMAGAVAVAQAVEQTAPPLRPEVKWPNDVRINGRKCCGMLLESSASGRSASAPRCVVLGIGLNVNQDAFPPELTDTATSLLLETGQAVDRPALLACLLERLEQQYALAHSNPRAVHRAFEERLAQKGREVTFRLSATSEFVTGVLEGVAEKGALILRTPTGPRIFVAGEITTNLTETEG